MRTCTLALAALLLVACNDDRDPAPLVKTPRILAMIVDPPEALPGEDVRLRMLAFDPASRPLTYDYRICLDPGSFFGNITADMGDPDTGAMAICQPVPGSDATVVVDGMFTDQLYRLLPTFAAQAHLSADTLQGLVDTVGIPLQLRVRITAPDPVTGEPTLLITGVKEFGMTTRAHRTTNPPYVYFSIEDSVFLGGVDPDSFECTLWGGTDAPVLHASVPGMPVRTAHLAPLDNPFDWEETYPYIDYSQSIQIGREGAYYSWFTTSDAPERCTREACHTIRPGDDTTQVSATADPNDPTAFVTRETEWDLPSTPGTYHFWLVVRDGHLGEAACHTTITIIP